MICFCFFFIGWKILLKKNHFICEMRRTRINGCGINEVDLSLQVFRFRPRSKHTHASHIGNSKLSTGVCARECAWLFVLQCSDELATCARLSVHSNKSLENFSAG